VIDDLIEAQTVDPYERKLRTQYSIESRANTSSWLRRKQCELVQIKEAILTG